MDDAKQIVGIDLGGTKIEIGLFSHNGNLLWRKKIPTHADKGGDQAMDRIAHEVKTLCATHANTLNIGGIGICAPGPIDNVSGIIYNACNLPWGEYHLISQLKERISLPIVADHDAKVAGLGTYYFGLNEKEKNFVYIVIGTGVGGAIFHNGHIFRGLTNCAGEIGFMTMDYGATHNTPGDIIGNVESYLGGPDINEYYHVRRRELGMPQDPTVVNVKDIGVRAQAGENAARDAINRAGLALGILVSTLSTVLDYDLFIIGGSVSKLGAQLITPAYDAIKIYSHSYFAKKIRIEVSTLTDDAALLGCYRLIRAHLHAQTIS